MSEPVAPLWPKVIYPTLVLALFAPAAYLAATGRFQPVFGLGALVLVPLGLALLGWAVGAWVQGGTLKALPVSPIAYAAHGLTKVRGQAEATHGLTFSETGGISCLFFSESTERYERKTKTEYDASTKTHRTKTYYEWDTIHSASERRPFAVRDDTGSLPVDVTRTEFHPVEEAYFRNGHPVASPVGSASVGETRTTVHFLSAGTPVTVLGRLFRGTVGYDEYRRCMLVIAGDDGRVYTGRGWKAFGFAFLGLVILIGMGAFTLAQPQAYGTPGSFESDIALAVAGVGIALTIGLIRTGNLLVRLKKGAESAWSEIDVMLQRRLDLIPNLVETARAQAGHEQAALVRLTELREAAQQASQRSERVQAEDAVTTQIAQIWRWPELRTSGAFLGVQRALVEVEEAIADRRESYNQAATDYNEAQETFPTNLVAGLFGCHKRPLFQADLPSTVTAQEGRVAMSPPGTPQ